MPQFFYKARNGPKDLITGVIEADTLANAISKLAASGKIPIEVKPFDGSTDAPAFGEAQMNVPTGALLGFTRQMADLLAAGIPLLRCMDLCSRQKRYPMMRSITLSLKASLEQGGSFSYALARHPAIFSPLYINAIKAGEASAQLPLVVGRLAQFLEQDMGTREKIKASLLYPFIIFCVGTLTIIILLTFVLPRLTIMFDDFDADLPVLTQVVIAISQLFANYWWFMLGMLFVTVIWVKRFMNTAGGKEWRDSACLRFPLVRTFVENVQLGRFARTLGMLIESGVPVVTALELVVAVVDNVFLQNEVRAIAVKVKGGMSLPQAVKTSTLFPEMALDLITVGQESGKLENGLYQLAAGCERYAQETTQIFVTILGPAVLVMVVGIVGTMIIAMLLPLFQINAIIK